MTASMQPTRCDNPASTKRVVIFLGDFHVEALVSSSLDKSDERHTAALESHVSHHECDGCRRALAVVLKASDVAAGGAEDVFVHAALGKVAGLAARDSVVVGVRPVGVQAIGAEGAHPSGAHATEVAARVQ